MSADSRRITGHLEAARRRLAGEPQRRGLASAIAVELGVNLEDVLQTAANVMGLAIADASYLAAVRPVDRPLASATCRRLGCVGVVGADSVLEVLVDDPWAVDAIRQIAQACGRTPRILWSDRATIGQLIERIGMDAGPAGRPETGGDVSADARAASAGGDAGRVIDGASIDAAGSIVVKFVDRHLLTAWRMSASDIHVEMLRGGDLTVKYRIDGVLVPAPVFSAELVPGEAVINRVKVLAQLDISETRIPQDGRFRAVIGGRGVDFRVSIMPSIFGEDAVVRLLDKAQLRTGDDRIDLGRLGFDQTSLDRLRVASAEPHGMILVTGPTGSGKTTTLYALLSQMHRSDEKVITIEDPVEYELPGVLQIPVNEKKGLNFARGLRSILRHDPDKILVGEIRDSETAEIAVQAALTGHLVFTTVHANNVYDVVGRFLHMSVDLYGFASSLNCLVAQRLLRTNCPHCARPTDDSGTRSALATAGVSLSAGVLRRGAGCEHCRGTGYAGRCAIAEVLPVDDGFRELVVARASGRDLRRHVAQLGVTPLRAAALALVASGRTTYEEVLRVVGSHD